MVAEQDIRVTQHLHDVIAELACRVIRRQIGLEGSRTYAWGELHEFGDERICLDL